MPVDLKSLSLEVIDHSEEIQVWLNKFPEWRTVAIELLLQLKFVSSDVFSQWLKQTLQDNAASPCAIIAVRKLESEVTQLWDENGKLIRRSSSSLGSEDLVNSVIAALVKLDRERFVDHPHLDTMKEKQIHEIVLLDDSIGSGQRVIEFLTCLMKHKRILSWWNFGYIRLKIIAFSRTQEAEKRIINSLPGSDHPTRKFKRSSKVSFISEYVHDPAGIASTWGRRNQQIVDFCDSIDKIPWYARRGFGKTMSNLVFFHSVPDNLPGVLWYHDADWEGLFPKRNLPTWLPKLLGQTHNQQLGNVHPVSNEAMAVLRHCKRGITNENSIAWAMSLDCRVTKLLLQRLRGMGLLSDGNRITEASRALLRKKDGNTTSPDFDRSMYVPQTWCAGRVTVQPSEQVGAADLLQTDSDDGSPDSDGEVGKASLERTDAKTAAPSVSVAPLDPSARVSSAEPDTHGHKG
ncbi:phosphoribosyltransferase-like protein [Aureliella helgolandensis]|uniref:Uncharacterized protein n=1 Tax=Aureliella helgolandensis TaxID=2527968 RepID=A0A518GFJ8_9BACT|nr:hypothetical protein [Aureliella helgolandensis]QDV27371.1 hypothetical protein Q31a_57600 [Aureliella helgolandensis]